MKKFINFFVCVVFAMVAFTSCSSDSDEPVTTNPLVGLWEIIENNGDISNEYTYATYTFHDDGTGIFKEVDNETGEIYEMETFTYVFYTETERGVIRFGDDPEYDTYIELINKSTIKVTYRYDDEIEYDICVKK